MKVTLIDSMGSDLTVVNAARVSFDKHSEEFTGKDESLIKYLASHNHWTPFGHCFAQFRIKAPLFSARQLAKHQVGLVWNEVSRRYVDSEPEFYRPESWRAKADNVKQGSSEVDTIPNCLLTEPYEGLDYDEILTICESWYSHALGRGVCPEQARMVLPQSMYTEWYWSGSLAAFARVCKLRLDPHTQRETREIAVAIDAELRKLFPVSWSALLDA